MAENWKQKKRKLEMEMPRKRWMDKQTLVNPNNRIVFNNKKETINTCYYTDEYQNNYAEWKKPDKRVQTVWDSIYIKLLAIPNNLWC